MEKGMSAEDARTMVNIIARNKKTWLDIMMLEELGIMESDDSPFKNAVATFISFSVFGFIPLVTHVIAVFLPGIRPYVFVTACVLTGVTLFTLGALKVRITERHWFVSGVEMFLVGGIAAAAAYVIGYLLSGLA
jgi:VIT1/CCC1 family predicted Fe2+/Mn2+ transporter